MSTQKPRPRDWPPRINTLDDAYRVARESFGGLFFYITTTLGLFLTVFNLNLPGRDWGAEEYGQISGVVVELLLVAFCTWRVRVGKGWIAGSILVLLYSYELFVKASSGTLKSFGWIVFHIIVLASLILGAYACIQVRRRIKRSETRTIAA